MKPIQTLDLESLSIAGACAVPGKASDYLHVLSLFGTIGKLVITELPEVTCTCALKDAIAAQAVRRASRSTPEYFERMFRHHPPRSRLAVGELDLRELRYWPMPLLFVLKTLQHTSTVRSLTSLAVSFRGTREAVACGELLRLCGAGLRHCKIEMVHGMFQPHALESDVLSLSSCTSLETLCLTTEQTPPSKSPGLTVSPMFVDILAHVPTANLEHLVLALRPCSGSREETGDQWSKLRDFLRRCVSLQTLAFVVESEDRNVKDVVCMEMAEWHERRIVIFNTGL
ncbi:hypothetical protein EUX98_g7674 [Antrodiella citrinella]|uniref:FBD domain-containing protein n=1 Tax=Antrodiella citrinella TaxID=2447956 RepID=A0A4S4MMU1_9APHY|nr:hypothetical protein EUX98_g7674 [Antrodiella citrinella]